MPCKSNYTTTYILESSFALLSLVSSLNILSKHLSIQTNTYRYLPRYKYIHSYLCMYIYVYRYDELRLSVHELTTEEGMQMENTLEKKTKEN